MPRGLPRIELGPGRQVEQSGGLRQLDKEEAYKYRDRPVPRAVVNPISANQRVKLNATVAGAPDPEEFALPRNWKVTRRERIVPAKDNIFHGSCRKRNQDGSLGKKDKPRLRSLAEVYECLYTERKRNTPFCNGNPQPPCDELYTQASRTQLAPRIAGRARLQSPPAAAAAEELLLDIDAYQRSLDQAIQRTERAGVPDPGLAELVAQLMQDGDLPPIIENEAQNVAQEMVDYVNNIDFEALGQDPANFQPLFPWD